MAKYSIFINRVKCIETTSGSGNDEIYGIKFYMEFKGINGPTMNIERISIGSFSAGHSIWLSEGKKYLLEAEEIESLKYTMFFLLLAEKDDTPGKSLNNMITNFKAWFPEKIYYYFNRYEWRKPDQWRKKFISATYNKIDQLFNDATENPGVDDDTMIDRNRIVIYQDDLDYVWKSKE